MFVCEAKCKEKHLSKRGQEWPAPSSYGPCEICGDVGSCLDISSGWDWAWKSTSSDSGDEPLLGSSDG